MEGGGGGEGFRVLGLEGFLVRRGEARGWSMEGGREEAAEE